MKKIYFLIALFYCSSNLLFSQATPNAGFENWTAGTGITPYEDPDNWNTLNPTTSSLGVITCEKATAAQDIHSGAAAIKLTTKTVLSQTVSGIATTGTLNATNYTISGGIPYTGRPDSIVGYYKAMPMNTDNGVIAFYLTGAGGDTDTVGVAIFNTPSGGVIGTGAYRRFSAPLVYKKIAPSVKSIWLLSSSSIGRPTVGSVLFVDDLQLISKTVGVGEQAKKEITVGPNPASAILVVNNPTNIEAKVSVYDVTGRKVLAQTVNDIKNTIDVSAFPTGLYIYTIVDSNNTIIKTDKIIIQK